MAATYSLGRITAFFEDAEQLDAAASVLRGAAGVLTAPMGLKGVLTGEAVGSPLHPAFVHLPIGGAVGALVVDVLGDDDLDEAVSLLTALTVITAVPSAMTGVADYATKFGAGVRRLGAAHALVNAAGTTMAAASWVARRAGTRGLARVLLVGSVSAYGLGGMLGGHIVHAEQQPAPVA